jgi:hypothetical protein
MGRITFVNTKGLFSQPIGRAVCWKYSPSMQKVKY